MLLWISSVDQDHVKERLRSKSHHNLHTVCRQNELELQAVKICPLARKEQNSLPFNYRLEVIMKDIVLVLSVFKDSFGQFLFASWEGFKMLHGMTFY